MKPANNAPIYASIYSELAEVCRSKGYALAVHGSLARDFDLICVPWDTEISTPREVIDALTAKFALRLLENADVPAYTMKPWGRESFTLIFAWGDTALDISFTPRKEPSDG